MAIRIRKGKGALFARRGGKGVVRLHARTRRALKHGAIAKNGGIFRCHYCGVAMLADGVTFDHRLAVTNGGDSRSSNLLKACGKCNFAKGALPYEAFKELMLPVKQARSEGLPLPEVLPTPAQVRASRNQRKKKARELRKAAAQKEQGTDGYTKDLLFDCLRVNAMRRTGRTWKDISEITGFEVRAVRVMDRVGGLKPRRAGMRRELAEQLGLLALIQGGASLPIQHLEN